MSLRVRPITLGLRRIVMRGTGTGRRIVIRSAATSEGGPAISERRLLPNTVGTPGQTVVVNEAGTAVEYVDAAPRPVDVTFVLVEPGLAFDPTTDPVQLVGAAYLFQGTEPSGDPDEGWEPWEHTGLWQGTSTVSNPSSVMTRLPHELRSGDSFHSHAMINLKELVDPPAGRSYPPYGTDTTTSRIAFINSIVVGEEQVASVDNPKFILLDEQSQPGFVQGQWKPRVITEDDEVGWLDKVIYADTSGGDISLDAAQLDDEPDSFRHVGRLLVVKNTGSGVLTITNIGTVAPLGEGESAWLHVTESAVEVIAAVSAGGGGGSGDVVGPASSTDGRPALFDGTTGKLLKVGGVNTPDGLLRLNEFGVAPPTTLPSDLVRTSELTTAVDAKVADAINDGTTTVAPSQNAVYDALATKADLASPALTGDPTAPTQAPGNNSTRLATTAYVQAEAVPKSTVTTKGDLIVGTGAGTVTRRAAGANGTMMVPDSTQTDGFKSTPIGVHNTPAASYYLPEGALIDTWYGVGALSSNAANSSQVILEQIYDVGAPGFACSSITVWCHAENAGAGAAMVMALYEITGPLTRSLISSAGSVSITSTGSKTSTFTAVAVPRKFAVQFALINIDTAGANPTFGLVAASPSFAPHAANRIVHGNNAPTYRLGQYWAGGSSMAWPASPTMIDVTGKLLMATVGVA